MRQNHRAQMPGGRPAVVKVERVKHTPLDHAVGIRSSVPMVFHTHLDEELHTRFLRC